MQSSLNSAVNRFKRLAILTSVTCPRSKNNITPRMDTKSLNALPKTKVRFIEPMYALARISHDGIISRAASAENTFTSMIRGDQHYCHGDRQSIGRRWLRFGFARANARFAGVAIPSLPI